MAIKDELGRHGEDLAAAHLVSAGMRVLERNWRCGLGEIDLVAVDGRCLVVCEVKTRRSDRSGSAVEAVTPAKLGRLRRLTGAWLAQQEARFAEIRIDVIAIRQPRDGPADIQHLRGVA